MECGYGCLSNFYLRPPESRSARNKLTVPSGNAVLRNPKPRTTGNLSALWIEGPSRLGLDVAMMKSVHVGEGTAFTLRIDAINVLNTPI